MSKIARHLRLVLGIAASAALLMACDPAEHAFIPEDWEGRALMYVSQDLVRFQRTMREQVELSPKLQAYLSENLTNAQAWPGVCDIEELVHSFEGLVENQEAYERRGQVWSASQFGCPAAAACHIEDLARRDLGRFVTPTHVVMNQYLWGFATKSELDRWRVRYRNRTGGEFDAEDAFSFHSSVREFLSDDGITKEQAVPNCPAWEPVPLAAGGG